MRYASRTHKYGAKATVVDGIRFHSRREARRYQELKLLERAGEIEELELQPRFRLCAPLTTGTVRGALQAAAESLPVVGHYFADFAYLDCRTGQRVVEDAKGFKTELYRWKKKHVEKQYGIEVREV